MAAHHRFGARTGGANLMIGGIFIAMALIFGSSAVSILGLIPMSILGVLLVFTGIQMVKLATDVRGKGDFIVVFTVVGLALMVSITIAFIAGIILYYLLAFLSKVSIALNTKNAKKNVRPWRGKT